MPTGYIYFIEENDKKTIKIGFTMGNPFNRLSTLQTGNSSKLSLKALIKGESQFEKYLHYNFKHLKIRGEWFNPNILKELENVRDVNFLDMNIVTEQFEITARKKRIRPEIKNYFSENLKLLTKGLVISQLARDINMSNSLLNDWVSARRSPCLKNLQYVLKLSREFNVSFEDLVFKKLKNVDGSASDVK